LSIQQLRFVVKYTRSGTIDGLPSQGNLFFCSVGTVEGAFYKGVPHARTGSVNVHATRIDV
jgi:hypothetical protein